MSIYQVWINIFSCRTGRMVCLCTRSKRQLSISTLCRTVQSLPIILATYSSNELVLECHPPQINSRELVPWWDGQPGMVQRSADCRSGSWAPLGAIFFRFEKKCWDTRSTSPAELSQHPSQLTAMSALRKQKILTWQPCAYAALVGFKNLGLAFISDLLLTLPSLLTWLKTLG